MVVLNYYLKSPLTMHGTAHIIKLLQFTVSLKFK